MSWFRESDLTFEPAVQQKELHGAWKTFVETGRLSSDIVPPHIAESWQRSRALGIDPVNIPPTAYLDPDEYERRKAEHRYLSAIARPFVENVYQHLEQSRYVAVLYDPGGYHLFRIGQRADFQRASQFAIREGISLAEEVIGTTGFGLAKRYKKPVQILGCEHYHAMLHYVVGSYAPISDPASGDLIGVVGVAGARTQPNPHMLALVAAAGEAIEHSIRLDRGRKRFLLYGRALQATMDTLPDGVLLIDRRGRVFEHNIAAREIFGLTGEGVRGKHVAEVLGEPELERRILETLESRDREGLEIDIQIRDQLYMASVRFARDDKEEEARGVIVHLKNVRSMSRLVHQISGDNPKFTLESMMGSSPKVREIKALARVAAESEASVIIEGESGTGKEVLAHVIHNASPRASQPLIVINCSAVPSELMESILFGHEKGAFTGAVHTHVGKFELADKGTIFLDEIGEMPLTMQAKLLRVLEEHTIERVGGKKSIQIDIRVIAATNRDLAQEVKKNRVRGDLFYRLNVFRFVLPPLRDRMEEIRDLVPHFVEQMSPLFNKKVRSVSDDYFRVLAAYGWPGNIRELKNAVKYSMAMLDGPILMERHIAGFFTQRSEETREAPPGLPAVEPPSASASTLSELERLAIQRCLVQAKGNKSKAAKLLGIGRATLHRKLKYL